MTAYVETTQASYDTVAADYAELLKDELAASPFDRSMLDLFAELVKRPAADLERDPNGYLVGGQLGELATAPAGEVVARQVGDLGCGPGRVTTYLASLGLEAFGIDLSPEMVAVARKTYPDLRFEVGTLLDLDLPDNHLAGALAWYSLVHTPVEDLPKVFAEIHRVLAPGGLLLHAFKVGTGGRHLDHAYGHPLSLDVYYYQPTEIADLLTAAGFTEVGTFTRAAIKPEKTPQSYLLFSKPES